MYRLLTETPGNNTIITFLFTGVGTRACNLNGRSHIQQEKDEGARRQLAFSLDINAGKNDVM